jgi:hypothetical protein
MTDIPGVDPGTRNGMHQAPGLAGLVSLVLLAFGVGAWISGRPGQSGTDPRVESPDAEPGAAPDSEGDQ